MLRQLTPTLSSASDSGTSPQQASNKSSALSESRVDRLDDGGDDRDLL
jgi:hypothetical protein